MDSKDSSRAEPLHDFHILTVIEDRAESAGPPPLPAETDDEEDAHENR